MPGRQSPHAEESSEYQQDRRFVLELCSFLDSLPRPATTLIGEGDTDGTITHREIPTPELNLARGLEEGMVEAERCGVRSARSGIRMALHDLLEMSRDLTAAQVREANNRMACAGLPTLTAMRERIWQTLSKVLKRRRCRTEAEYYFVVERVNSVGDELSPEDRRRLESIIADFESHRRG